MAEERRIATQIESRRRLKETIDVAASICVLRAICSKGWDRQHMQRKRAQITSRLYRSSLNSSPSRGNFWCDRRYNGENAERSSRKNWCKRPEKSCKQRWLDKKMGQKIRQKKKNSAREASDASHKLRSGPWKSIEAPPIERKKKRRQHRHSARTSWTNALLEAHWVP